MGESKRSARPESHHEHAPEASEDTSTVDAERLAIVARSTENLTHEMNNALMSLANYAEIAAMPQVSPEQRGSHLARVSALVDELAELVRVLRAVAVDDAGELVRVDLAKLTRRAVTAARTGVRHAGVTFEPHVPDAPCFVRVREGELLHAIVGYLLVAAEAVAEPPRPGERTAHVTILLESVGRGTARVVVRATGGLANGVVPSLRAFELPRSLAIRAGAASSIGVEGSPGAIVAQLTVPLVESVEPSR